MHSPETVPDDTDSNPPHCTSSHSVSWNDNVVLHYYDPDTLVSPPSSPPHRNLSTPAASENGAVTSDLSSSSNNVMLNSDPITNPVYPNHEPARVLIQAVLILLVRLA
jgi:hypothetical protein